MVTDQEIAKGVETVLRQSDPNSLTPYGVVSQLEAKLGLDLSHKTAFINDHINLLLRSHPTSTPPPPPPPPPPPAHPPQSAATAIRFQQKDPFALQPHPQFQQFPSHFALSPQQQHHHHHLQQLLQQQQQQYVFRQDLNFGQPQPPPPPPPQRQLQQVVPTPAPQNAPSATTPTASKGSGKRRGGPGGLNKVCGVTPELEAVVGHPALPRTEIVKQLWLYIRKNNLQDPSNKRKIVCDDALRLVFDTDCTDMFKMNKLLAKHIIPLEPTKESSKRVKVDVESTPANSKTGQSVMVISEALAKFLGTAEEREMTQLEASKRVWEYIKVNHLEDPVNPMVIQCDAKLSELLGRESISAVGVEEMLGRHHLSKQS